MKQSYHAMEGQDIITTNPSKRLLDYANVAMEIEQEVFVHMETLARGCGMARTSSDLWF